MKPVSKPLVFCLIVLSLLTNMPAFADWTHEPVPVNLNENPYPDYHFNSGGRRIVRIQNTVIALAPRSKHGDWTYRSTDNGKTWETIDTDGRYSGCLVSGKDEMVYHFYLDRDGGNIYMVSFKYDEDTDMFQANIPKKYQQGYKFFHLPVRFKCASHSGDFIDLQADDFKTDNEITCQTCNKVLARYKKSEDGDLGVLIHTNRAGEIRAHNAIMSCYKCGTSYNLRTLKDKNEHIDFIPLDRNL